MVLRIKCFSIPRLKRVQRVCNTEVVGKVRHFIQYSLFPESQQKCHWQLFLPKESRPRNGWAEVKMKRIFLQFPIAGASPVEQPVTPATCRSAQERQKDGHQGTSTGRRSQPRSPTPHALCMGTGWKPRHSEGKGYCGMQAARLQTAKSNSFHTACNWLRKLTVTAYGSG